LPRSVQSVARAQPAGGICSRLGNRPAFSPWTRLTSSWTACRKWGRAPLPSTRPFSPLSSLSLSLSHLSLVLSQARPIRGDACLSPHHSRPHTWPHKSPFAGPFILPVPFYPFQLPLCPLSFPNLHWQDAVGKDWESLDIVILYVRDLPPRPPRLPIPRFTPWSPTGGRTDSDGDHDLQVSALFDSRNMKNVQVVSDIELSASIKVYSVLEILFSGHSLHTRNSGREKVPPIPLQPSPLAQSR
jgi:hypothetical protein